MNLVEQIKQQLSGAVIGQLSSVLGSSEASTGTALTAAVPALLSAALGSGLERLGSPEAHLRIEPVGHGVTGQPDPQAGEPTRRRPGAG